MSRSKHGHKHVGRTKCWVCTNGFQVAARKRDDEEKKVAIPDGVAEYDDQCEEKE